MKYTTASGYYTQSQYVTEDGFRETTDGQQSIPIHPRIGHVGTTSDPSWSFIRGLPIIFQANPGIEHWKVLLHIIGYIKNKIDYGLTYTREAELLPTAFVDADSQIIASI
jgi:hypothetical protein